MKSNRGCHRKTVSSQLGTAALAVALAATLPAMAAWRYWVGDDTTPGGPGTWNNSNTSWCANSAGNAPYYAWVAGDNATFVGATGGVVTVEGTVVSPQLQFYPTGYMLTNGTILSAGNTLTINVTNGATVTISSLLSTSYSGCTIKRNLFGVSGDGGTLILNSVFPQNDSGGGSFSAFYLYQGTTIMTGDNYYSGTMTQNGATQYGVLIQNGKHYNPAGYTFQADGTLGGTGTVQFADSGKAVNMYGTLTPGTATEIGTLTIAVGDLKFYSTARANFQVDLTANAADKVVVGDLLTYAGTLNVQMTGVRNRDASYTLFQFGSKTGSFAAVNITGVNPNKAEVSFDGNTGTLTYHPLPPRGTLIAVQ